MAVRVPRLHGQVVRHHSPRRNGDGVSSVAPVTHEIVHRRVGEEVIKSGEFVKCALPELPPGVPIRHDFAVVWEQLQKTLRVQAARERDIAGLGIHAPVSWGG